MVTERKIMIRMAQKGSGMGDKQKNLTSDNALDQQLRYRATENQQPVDN
jgi:hypothetical protein